MSEKTSTDQYGRKQWDVDAYEAEAKQGGIKTPQHLPDQALGQKLKSKDILQLRAHLVGEAVSSVGKHTLIAQDKASTSTYGKNKRFGFACPTCDLSFRDTLALVDHFNSPQHLKNLRRLQQNAPGEGEEQLEEGVRRASVAQVMQTLEELVKKSLRSKAAAGSVSGGVSLQERVLRRVAFEQSKARRKQERRKKKKEAMAGGNSLADGPDTELSQMMGFAGFGSTKQG
ncbi:hypothetical protein JCM33374_g4507 [Metschnikowia sp. JCM 33374]|nr:hypothetical protein JCM33374_g4507 [Metschnikowia sp. JCM 33374]